MNFWSAMDLLCTHTNSHKFRMTFRTLAAKRYLAYSKSQEIGKISSGELEHFSQCAIDNQKSDPIFARAHIHPKVENFSPYNNYIVNQSSVAVCQQCSTSMLVGWLADCCWLLGWGLLRKWPNGHNNMIYIADDHRLDCLNMDSFSIHLLMDWRCRIIQFLPGRHAGIVLQYQFRNLHFGLKRGHGRDEKIFL